MFFMYVVYFLIFLLALWILGNKFLVEKEDIVSKSKRKVLNKEEILTDLKNEKEDLSTEIEITTEIKKCKSKVEKRKSKLEKIKY